MWPSASGCVQPRSKQPCSLGSPSHSRYRTLASASYRRRQGTQAIPASSIPPSTTRMPATIRHTIAGRNKAICFWCQLSPDPGFVAFIFCPFALFLSAVGLRVLQNGPGSIILRRWWIHRGWFLTIFCVCVFDVLPASLSGSVTGKQLNCYPWASHLLPRWHSAAKVYELSLQNACFDVYYWWRKWLWVHLRHACTSPLTVSRGLPNSLPSRVGRWWHIGKMDGTFLFLIVTETSWKFSKWAGIAKRTHQWHKISAMSGIKWDSRYAYSQQHMLFYAESHGPRRGGKFLHGHTSLPPPKKKQYNIYVYIVLGMGHLVQQYSSDTDLFLTKGCEPCACMWSLRAGAHGLKLISACTQYHNIHNIIHHTCHAYNDYMHGTRPP